MFTSSNHIAPRAIAHLAAILSTAAMGTALSLLLGAASPAWADPPAPNPFAGSWSGPGTVDNEPVGTLDLTISDQGVLTGRVYHLQDDQSGDLVGHVSADGDVRLINFVPSDNPLHGNGVPLEGSVMIVGDDLVAELTATFADSDDPLASDGPPLVAILERN